MSLRRSVPRRETATSVALATMAVSMPAAAGAASVAGVAYPTGPAPVPRALPQTVTAIPVPTPPRRRPPVPLGRPPRDGLP